MLESWLQRITDLPHAAEAARGMAAETDKSALQSGGVGRAPPEETDPSTPESPAKDRAEAAARATMEPLPVKRSRRDALLPAAREEEWKKEEGVRGVEEESVGREPGVGGGRQRTLAPPPRLITTDEALRALGGEEPTVIAQRTPLRTPSPPPERARDKGPDASADGAPASAAGGSWRHQYHIIGENGSVRRDGGVAVGLWRASTFHSVVPPVQGYEPPAANGLSHLGQHASAELQRRPLPWQAPKASSRFLQRAEERLARRKAAARALGVVAGGGEGEGSGGGPAGDDVARETMLINIASPQFRAHLEDQRIVNDPQARHSGPTAATAGSATDTTEGERGGATEPRAPWSRDHMNILRVGDRPSRLCDAARNVGIAPRIRLPTDPATADAATDTRGSEQQRRPSQHRRDHRRRRRRMSVTAPDGAKGAKGARRARGVDRDQRMMASGVPRRGRAAFRLARAQEQERWRRRVQRFGSEVAPGAAERRSAEEEERRARADQEWRQRTWVRTPAGDLVPTDTGAVDAVLAGLDPLAPGQENGDADHDYDHDGNGNEEEEEDGGEVFLTAVGGQQREAEAARRWEEERDRAARALAQRKDPFLIPRPAAPAASPIAARVRPPPQSNARESRDILGVPPARREAAAAASRAAAAAKCALSALEAPAGFHSGAARSGSPTKRTLGHERQRSVPHTRISGQPRPARRRDPSTPDHFPDLLPPPTTTVKEAAAQRRAAVREKRRLTQAQEVSGGALRAVASRVPLPSLIAPACGLGAVASSPELPLSSVARVARLGAVGEVNFRSMQQAGSGASRLSRRGRRPLRDGAGPLVPTPMQGGGGGGGGDSSSQVSVGQVRESTVSVAMPRLSR